MVLSRFNPRTHTGCDLCGHIRHGLRLCFNPRTHTGCDLNFMVMVRALPLFQSTHPHGVRPTICGKCKDTSGFQSTHPHGVRLGGRETGVSQIGFNPRTHTGCDEADYQSTKIDRMFQSTHPHGVRLNQLNPKEFQDLVSIHAPTRGATRCQVIFVEMQCCFNPRTHTGCDFATQSRTHSAVSFNPRTHTGCDF